jgi:hypothetical protein
MAETGRFRFPVIGSSRPTSLLMPAGMVAQAMSLSLAEANYSRRRHALRICARCLAMGDARDRGAGGDDLVRRIATACCARCRGSSGSSDRRDGPRSVGSPHPGSARRNRAVRSSSCAGCGSAPLESGPRAHRVLGERDLYLAIPRTGEVQPLWLGAGTDLPASHGSVVWLDDGRAILCRYDSAEAPDGTVHSTLFAIDGSELTELAPWSEGAFTIDPARDRRSATVVHRCADGTISGAWEVPSTGPARAVSLPSVPGSALLCLHAEEPALWNALLLSTPPDGRAEPSTTLMSRDFGRSWSAAVDPTAPSAPPVAREASPRWAIDSGCGVYARAAIGGLACGGNLEPETTILAITAFVVRDADGTECEVPWRSSSPRTSPCPLAFAPRERTLLVAGYGEIPAAGCAPTAPGIAPDSLSIISFADGRRQELPIPLPGAHQRLLAFDGRGVLSMTHSRQGSRQIWRCAPNGAWELSSDLDLPEGWDADVVMPEQTVLGSSAALVVRPASESCAPGPRILIACHEGLDPVTLYRSSGIEDAPRHVAWSADGRALAWMCGDRLQVWMADW